MSSGNKHKATPLPIQRGGLTLVFKCPDCDNMTDWYPETLHTDGTPYCQNIGSCGELEECGTLMEFFGYRVENNRSESDVRTD